MLRDMTTIIFDADHTLYTPVSDAAYDAKFAFLADHTPVEKEVLRRTWDRVMKQAIQSKHPGERERKQLIRETLQVADVHPDDDLIDDAYSVFWETVARDTKPNGSIRRTIRRLRDAGFSLAVATDEYPEPVRIKLNTVFQSTHIDSVFDIIVTPLDTGTYKPSERFYTTILEKLDAEMSQTVVVGDSWGRDLQPAAKMGATTILVTDAEQNEEALDPDPDFRIKTIDELAPILLEDES